MKEPMTPQEQPDSQAGDELRQKLSIYMEIYAKGKEVSDVSAMTAALDYAERLAAERTIEELKALKPLVHPYDGNDMVLDILNDRIAILTGEAKQ